VANAGRVFAQQVKHIIYVFVFGVAENSMKFLSKVVGYGFLVHLKKK